MIIQQGQFDWALAIFIAFGEGRGGGVPFD